MRIRPWRSRRRRDSELDEEIKGHLDMAARDLGMSAVHYQHNDQAIPEIRAALGL